MIASSSGDSLLPVTAGLVFTLKDPVLPMVVPAGRIQPAGLIHILVDIASHDGPMQYKDLDHIEVRRKIEKDKGSKFYINDKEVRARETLKCFLQIYLRVLIHRQ